MRLAIMVLFARAVTPATAADSVAVYPERPIRMLVGQSAGGASDIVARGLAQKLNEALGQPVVVDNRGGAAGSIAAALVARAAPDGYTVLVVPGSFTINPSLYKNLPFDPQKDLAAVTLIATAPYVLMLNPALPAKSVGELIALAKAKPRELAYGSAGFGSSGHLAAELFSSMAGVQMNHVPYKGAGPALVDLLGGQLQLVFGSVVASLPYQRNGRLRALGVTSAQRLAMVPELPTIAEAGLPGYEFTSWFGLLAPAATPRPIVLKLQTAVAAALRTPELSERLTREGSEPVGSTPDQFAVFVKAETAKWAAVVKRSGMRAE
jgi:tripartite-type tricarboxylate transporter receptor subunit TctC